MGPMRDSRRLPEEGAVENFDNQPGWQKPIRRRFEAARTQKEPPEHLDAHLGETYEERTHERSNRPRRSQCRHDAPRIQPGIELHGSSAGNQVESAVQGAPPEVLQDESSQP